MTMPIRFENGENALIFLIHGLNRDEDDMAELRLLVQNCYPNADVHVPTFSHSSLFSRTPAAQHVKNIIDKISKAYDSARHERIMLIGHSMGAVLARRVVVESSGLPTRWSDNAEAGEASLKVEPELADCRRMVWADKLEVLIMMASVGRGWTVENAKDGWQRFQWNLGSIIGHLMPGSAKPTIFAFRKGSPFIVQTRLRWLDYCKENPDNRVRLVQFLGTKDELVPPNDAIDFATADDKAGNFLQIEVPDTDHGSIIQLDPKLRGNQEEVTSCRTRSDLVSAVLKGEVDKYQDNLVKRDYLMDELPSKPDYSVKNLVFVVHGIRDRGYWTKKIAGRIKHKALDQGVDFASRTPSYGYFPILPFLLPWYRRQKVEWLMDHYVEAAAAYPDADFHYVGHSNGTYLAARALLKYPHSSFKHIMFAGSVVRPDYPWKPLISSGRVSKVLNAVATFDWVVALFPHGLRHLKWLFDLGGAGHVGFDEKSLPDHLFQLDTEGAIGSERFFVKGSHSAAREEEMWDEIVDFIVEGKAPNASVSNGSLSNKQPWYSRYLGYGSPLIVAGIAYCVVAIGIELTTSMFVGFGIASLLALFLYFMFLRFIVLRY